MNQPKSIYKSDFGPHSWFENNFSSEVEEFCSPDNIDNCLEYISQEFNALGYPSITTVSSSQAHPFNCDIIKLLNVIFDFLKDFKEQIESKDELNSRNQRLESELNILCKKNSQLKEHLEQTDRKLNGSLERERQLKLKNEQLQNLLKSEKEECKKLSAQIQQQKVAYQREIRKNDNNLTQMKTKLNQILADKNPDKKVANISMSHPLQRNSNQRGKWKTESLAKSSTDEMYSSVLSTFENRCQMALKELEEYRLCFQFIDQQLKTILSSVEGHSHENVSPCLNAILYGNNIQEESIQKFQAMFAQVQDIITSKASDNKSLSEEVKVLKFELLKFKSKEYIEKNQLKTISDMSSEEHSFEVFTSPNDTRKCEEKNKNTSDQIELASTLAQIKEEKLKLETQKLVLIKNAIQQNPSNISHCSKSVPSFCILTTRNGVTSVPATYQLKQCLSDPNNPTGSMSPLWKADVLSPAQSSLSSATSTSMFEENTSPVLHNFASPIHPLANESLDEDLPNWARAAANISISEEDSINLESFIPKTNLEGISSKDWNVPVTQCSEEDNLAKLKAAVEDIENRRNYLFSKGK